MWQFDCRTVFLLHVAVISQFWMDFHELWGKGFALARKITDSVLGFPKSASLITGQTSNGRWCLSPSVRLHGGPAGGFTRAGQVMPSCRLQSNYSSMVTLHGGQVVLRPVRATRFFSYDQNC